MSRRKRSLIFFTVIMFCMLAIFGYAVLDTQRSSTNTPENAAASNAVTETRDQFRNTKLAIEEYFVRHRLNPDRYFLFTDLMNDPVAAGQQIDMFKGRLLQASQTYSGVNAFSRQIHERFRDFYLEVYWEGEGIIPETLVSEPPDPSDTLLVWLIPKEMVRHPDLHRNNFFYRGSGRAIIITAIDWAEPILAARLYHEMGHAYRHQVNQTQHYEDLGYSDAIAAGEVEMHLLEGEILQTASGGAFYTLLDRISDRCLEPDFERRRVQVYNAFTSQDLSEMDRILGLESAGDQMTRAHVGIFLNSLGFRLVERAYEEPERHQALMAQYRWLLALKRRLE